MDFMSWIRLLRRRWFVLLLAGVVGASLGLASTMLPSSSSSGPRVTRYQATTVLMNEGTGEGVYPSVFTSLEKMAVMATTGSVPDLVAESLGRPDQAPGLARRITTVTNGVTGTLSVTAVATSEQEAVDLSRTFADQLVTYMNTTDQARYDKAVAAAEARLTALQSRVNGLVGQLAADPANQIVQSELRSVENQATQSYNAIDDLQAQAPARDLLTVLAEPRAMSISAAEYESRLALGDLGQNNLQAGSGNAPAVSAGAASTSLGGPVPRAVLGFVLGLLLAAAVLVAKERFDHKIRTHADAEHAFGLPVLADVPSVTAAQRGGDEILVVAEPMSPFAEAYRALRSAIGFQFAAVGVLGGTRPQEEMPDVGPLVVMVASAMPEEGKTGTAANLACVFAETGQRVLVVNCDFRRPKLGQYFGLPDDPEVVQRTHVHGVSVVTNVATGTNPAQVVTRQRALVAAVRERFDVVVLDTAPLLSTNDAVDLLPDVDAVVVVGRMDSTTVPSARRAMEILERHEAPVIGLVLTDTGDASSHRYIYYYDTPAPLDAIRWAADEPSESTT